MTSLAYFDTVVCGNLSIVVCGNLSIGALRNCEGLA
jgi:hypothetical protein